MLDIEKTLLLARAILKLGYAKEAKLLYENLLSIQPNHNLAKKELNWSPKVDLDTGLEKTIKFFKEFYE